MQEKTIGEKIREYRQKQGMTQDALAAELHVSSQAVSKWETGQTMPDITLLLPMSRLLGVGVNELLGGSRRDEFECAWQNAQIFGEELSLIAAEDALKEFPDDEEFLFRRAQAEYDLGISGDKGKAQSVSYLGQAQEHFTELHTRFPDNDKYTVCLAEVYFARGRRDKALELAYSAKSSSRQKSLIAKYIGGEEEIRYKQTKLEGQTKNLYNTLLDLNTRESIDAAHALLDVMMGKGKVLRSNYLWSLYLADAELCLDEGDLEGYTEKFTKAYEAVKAYAALPNKAIPYTDPLFDRLQNERGRSIDLLHFFDRFLTSEKLGHPASLELRRRIADENVTCLRLWKHEWIAFYQFCKECLGARFCTHCNQTTEEVQKGMSAFLKKRGHRFDEGYFEYYKSEIERLVGGGIMHGFAAQIVGNRIVGYCNAWDKESYPNLSLPEEYRAVPEGEKIFFFAETVMAENFGNCGIDERLISTALDWADNNEYTKAEVCLWERSRHEQESARFDREVALYEKFGFRIVHDLTEDGPRKYIMQKDFKTSVTTVENGFKQFEREVMELIAKEKPEFEAKIMAQYDKCRIKSREFTGHGFYTDFEITDPADSFGDGIKEPFGSLYVDFPGVKYGAGFDLFVENGFITMLEGYVYGDESWPEKITEYKAVRSMPIIIKNVVDKYDPMGMLAMGCPKDEYRPETDRISGCMREDMTKRELSEVIYNVFLEMFSEPIDKELCDKMAQEILSAK